MRQAGALSNANLANRFADFLRAGGTACTVDQGADGYVVWVHDDDRVAAARDELTKFVANPGDAKYLAARDQVAAARRQRAQQQQAARRLTVNLSDKWNRPVAESCPITFGLIAVSVLIAVLTHLQPHVGDPRVDRLWFSNTGTLQPILNGEVWRAITPIFVHFSILHLVFNMMWLMQFGMLIEYRIGTPRFLAMVLVIGAISNFAQFAMVGPIFGGMSGVNYGLFGYIWVRGHLEPESGFGLPQSTILLMLIWYVAGVLGILGGIANWAHGVGLVMGVGLAMSRTLWKSLQRPK